MTFRYIGSKARLTDPILEIIGKPESKESRFVDLFCGTGAVAEAAHKSGWNVWLNDNLHSAVTMASARMISQDNAVFRELGGYSEAISQLNSSDGIEGFFWREYSPASVKFIEQERRYFTISNAMRIDAIRAKIKNWYNSGLLTESEQTLLLADLISAINRIANIAGTYGCFLSKWQNQALRPLSLSHRDLPSHGQKIITSCEDVFSLTVKRNDVVYLDPPYTKRQYASYYHLIETIVLNDNPKVSGVCGLRPWKDKASPFCYKRKALSSLVSLIERLESKHVYLSYSSEGHVDLKELSSALEISGKVKIIPISKVGRYRPNLAASSNGDSVNEFIIFHTKH